MIYFFTINAHVSIIVKAWLAVGQQFPQALVATSIPFVAFQYFPFPSLVPSSYTELFEWENQYKKYCYSFKPALTL